MYRGSYPAAGPEGVEWLQGELADTNLLAAALTPDVTHVLALRGPGVLRPAGRGCPAARERGGHRRRGGCLPAPARRMRLGYVSSVAALGQPAPAKPAGGPTPAARTKPPPGTWARATRPTPPASTWPSWKCGAA
ncbi:MAG: hypothetical protein WKG07_07190 [Hymenobacter sp.]